MHQNLQSLMPIIQNSKVILCVGSGGVGKTTLSSMIAVFAALLKKKVIVVTIDPAKRLADALGIGRDAGIIHNISIPVKSLRSFSKIQSMIDHDQKSAYSFDAMMIDPKLTFHHLLDQYSKEEHIKQSIVKTQIYQAVNQSFTSAQEHMAIEKLYELSTTHQYDLIIVDTPPSRHAVEFLMKPDFLTEFLDADVFKWLISEDNKGRIGTLFQKFLFRNVERFFSVLSRFTGEEIIRDIKDFFISIREIAEGMQHRTKSVKSLLRHSQTRYLIISGTDEVSLSEASFFIEEFLASDLPVNGLLINQVIKSKNLYCNAAKDSEWTDWISALNINEKAKNQLKLGVNYMLNLQTRQKDLLNNYYSKWEQRSELQSIPIVELPYIMEDITSLSGLLKVIEESL